MFSKKKNKQRKKIWNVYVLWIALNNVGNKNKIDSTFGN